MVKNVFDFCIVGGGMVGAATALGLAQRGFSIALIETRMPAAFFQGTPPDMRVSAISVTSEQLLDRLGAWSHIEAMRLCSYRRLSVWEKENCRTDFNCADIQCEHLGHIVENSVVQLGLHQALASYDKVQWFTRSPVKNIVLQGAPVIQLADGEQINCKILIGADGLNSAVRQAANIGTKGWQYRQQALAIQIKTHSAQQDITWQQFTPSGPLAFLPLYDNYASLVWYHSGDRVQHLKALAPDKLKQQIVANFPDELVDFDILQVASFPITRMHANQYVKENVMLIGDSAHCINPLAGQGVNLGFKDVAALLECLDKHSTVPQALQAYQQARRADNLMMMSAMDVIYATFSQSHPLVKLCRNLGLKLANASGPIKHQVMKYAMGL
ncbi:MAG: 2-octaprenyl-3-methyl-6-methoxy-1,4-benzoquinol hydroxylase [Paraglaciecola sp.]